MKIDFSPKALALRGWPVYFAILLSLALWVRDIDGQPDAFTTTLEEVIKISGLGDPVSYGTAALDIAANGWVSKQNRWVLAMWPPGFVLLEAAIVKVLGRGAPILLVLQILAAGLHAWFLTLFRDQLRLRLREPVALLLPLLLFAFPMARVFLLQPSGVSMGETFAIGFFLVGLAFAAASVQEGGVRRQAISSGLCLGLAAYFRPQFEFFLLALTGLALLFVLWVRGWVARRSNDPERTARLRSLAKTALVIVLAGQGLTVPWRIHRGTPQWARGSIVTYANSVKTSEELERAGGGFVVAGAGNLPCRIDPSTCGQREEAKKHFFRTFFAHPLQWYSLKLAVIGAYWFSPIENWWLVAIQPRESAARLTNWIFLLSLVGVVALLALPTARRDPRWPVLLWFGVAIYSAHAVIFTLAHFEARYFYFLKLFGFTLFVTLAALRYGARGQGDRAKTAGPGEAPQPP